jgi:hypothetical protein
LVDLRFFYLLELLRTLILENAYRSFSTNLVSVVHNSSLELGI